MFSAAFKNALTERRHAVRVAVRAPCIGLRHLLVLLLQLVIIANYHVLHDHFLILAFSIYFQDMLHVVWGFVYSFTNHTFKQTVDVRFDTLSGQRAVQLEKGGCFGRGWHRHTLRHPLRHAFRHTICIHTICIQLSLYIYIYNNIYVYMCIYIYIYIYISLSCGPRLNHTFRG